MQRSFLLLILFFSLGFLSSGCGSLNSQGPVQFAGIVDTIQFNTLACQEQEQKILYRNTNTKEPQAIKGIYFEAGTNPNDDFVIKEALIGDDEYPGVGNVIKDDVVIPAGGILEIHASYLPLQVTNSKKGEVSTTYLDIFLNGPSLGVVQYKLSGQAPQLAPGCGNWGTIQKFKVNKITITIKDKDIQPQTSPDENTTISAGQIQTVVSGDSINPLQFYVDNANVATLLGRNFPIFKIPTPGTGVSGVAIELPSGIYKGIFDGKNLEFAPLDFRAGGGLLTVPKVKVTTQNADATAPDVPDNGGVLSLKGSALDNKNMTIVFAAPIPQSDDLKQLNGGAVGVVMELTQQ